MNDKCIWLKLMIKYLWWKWDAMHETNKSRFMLTHVSRLRGWMKKNCISLRFYKVSVYHERKRFFCKNSKKNEKTANKECHKNDFRTKKYDLIGISYKKKKEKCLRKMGRKKSKCSIFQFVILQIHRSIRWLHLCHFLLCRFDRNYYLVVEFVFSTDGIRVKYSGVQWARNAKICVGKQSVK